jgi:hypothetical protein
MISKKPEQVTLSCLTMDFTPVKRVTQYRNDNKIKKAEMGMECSTRGRD